MSAPTHTPPSSAPRGGVDIRLPWWAFALPVLAFVTLLVLILEPGEAHAAGADPAITEVLERVQRLMAR
ncbi:hypothetical protein Stsp02_61500 [Streptomyces sp. NBRC 14336]|uniref:hypothetical protein n=1 Tax=Streptomyces sp. NBRC 14336 TaxID=3030992 RepID=UPI0024A3C4FF|nr:hypothetical protein [Streptomyces sp. NBRC 14336]WBO77134.1 hypothetical protein SBE_000632 [Streptomyces sp. SBE_14.2]GLW50489.1 hypothetical protein Stsp02_61500 [Streptomyces sp. NBRC 14336]